MDSLRVLIAEDDAIPRRILQRALEQIGHQCVVTCDGLEAWEALRTGDFDVLISDWLMPRMDGPELCRRVREPSSRPYTYIVLLTALDDKEHFLEGMEAGADDYLAKPFDPDALRARLLAAGRVLSLHRSLAEQNTKLALLNHALAASARTDPLTELGNRLRLMEDFQVCLSQAARYNRPFALALCDIDNFKRYNDRYGHLAGDSALRTVAQVLARYCRSGDSAYRFGGEEFVLFVPAQDLAGAEIAMDRTRQAIEDVGLLHEGNVPFGVLTISSGITALEPNCKRDAQTLLHEADQALYAAKAAGRNRTEAFTRVPALALPCLAEAVA